MWTRGPSHISVAVGFTAGLLYKMHGGHSPQATAVAIVDYYCRFISPTRYGGGALVHQ